MFETYRDRAQGTLPDVTVIDRRRVKEPEVPPLTPEQQTAVDALLSETVLGVPDFAQLSKPLTYVVAENGCWLLRTGPVGITCVPAAPPTIKGKLQGGLELTIPKIPVEIVQQILSFFRRVCKERSQSLEAYVQVWLHKPTNFWWIEVPEQRVSGGGVNHDGLSIPTSDYIHAADVHSHGSNMSAFFSSVDDGDEEDRGQRIFGVIGRVADNVPDFRWRVGLGDGKFIDLQMGHVVALPTIPMDVALDADETGFKALIRAAAVKCWDSVAIPDAWLEKVKTHTVGAYKPYSAKDWEDREVAYYGAGHSTSTHGSFVHGGKDRALPPARNLASSYEGEIGVIRARDVEYTIFRDGTLWSYE